jgi:hypothetical protein
MVRFSTLIPTAHQRRCRIGYGEGDGVEQVRMQRQAAPQHPDFV